MFGIGWPELLLVVVVGLLVIPPKDLPRVMGQVGRWVGKARDAMDGARREFDAAMKIEDKK